MTFVLTILVGLTGTELFFRLPFFKLFQELKDRQLKALRVLRSARISEHWKEAALPKYSLIIFGRTMQLALCTLMIVTPALLTGLWQPEVLHFLATPWGIILVTAVCLVYARLRRPPPPSDYGFLARLLHHVALRFRFVAEASFDMERNLCKPDAAKITGQRHVFVAGLARAGTTLLMRRFYATGRFCSLTYSDMPFVLMPGLWQRLSSTSKTVGAKRERAHADGLLVDFDSPEALEEVFWKNLSEFRYIHRYRLEPMPDDEELIGQFRTYVAAVIARYRGTGTLRYLSKNNNSILRLPLLHQAFPEALIIIPFRDPLAQAASLLRLHQRFIKLQSDDPFIRQYMSYLGHHEFGLDHRPFQLTPGHSNPYDPGTIDYWLQLWSDVYGWLAEQAPAGCVFVSYERLCRDTDAVWSALAERADIPADVVDADPVQERKPAGDPPAAATKLVTAAGEIYARLEGRGV